MSPGRVYKPSLVRNHYWIGCDLAKHEILSDYSSFLIKKIVHNSRHLLICNAVYGYFGGGGGVCCGVGPGVEGGGVLGRFG